MSRYSPETITEAVNACVAALSLEDLQADKAYDLDPRNLDALRLKTTIERLINSR